MPVSSSKKATATSGGSNDNFHHDFVLPADIPMDRGHTLDQLTSRFRGVRDGLPELVKNAKDQYSRLGVLDRESRQIVVLADTQNHSLGVLDFAGARASDFAGWTTWSSRTAGRSDLGDDIEAGHGNGGKAFMVRGALEYSFMESCFEGKRTRMGFRNERTKDWYKPGFDRVDGVRLDNVAEPNARACLDDYPDELGAEFEDLPQAAQDAFTKRNSFTGVLLSQVSDWHGRRKDKVRRLAAETIPELLASHGQVALSVETCQVWMIVDGKLITPQPVAPVVLEPFAGFEEPIVYEIPATLSDPETGDMVDMIAGHAGERYLRLQTSAKQLQMSEETKGRNVIRLWNARNNVANWPLQSLGVLMTSVSFIYGEVRCPALVGEHLAGADRIHLSDTPLVRALQEWTRKKVSQLAEEIYRALGAGNKPKDRDQAKSVLKSLRNLMRQFLDPDAAGETEGEEPGSVGHQKDGKTPPRPPKDYGTRIDEIVLEFGRLSVAMAEGTTIPLRYRCFEIESGEPPKPVKANGLVVRTTDSNVVVGGAGNQLTAVHPGSAEIWLETPDGLIKSSRLPCEVVATTDVNVVVPSEVLLQGQRLSLTITFATAAGPRSDLLIDGSIDEPGMGQLGRNGTFTAGYKEGQATVRVRYGSAPTASHATIVQIGPDRVPPPEGQGSRGSDIPEILLCGDIAPGFEDLPEQQRTQPGGENYPTIIEEPLFPNVLWINPLSKEAMRVRQERGGSSGVSSIASKNFAHFLALKCFDILKRLYVRQSMRNRGAVTEFEYIQLAVFAEMECADFIDAAWEISDALRSKAEAVHGQQAD